MDAIGSYIRIDSDPKVYLADQNVLFMLSTRETYWGELPKEDVLPIEPIEIPIDTTIN